MPSSNELARVARLKAVYESFGARAVGGEGKGSLLLGIGDDAAVLASPTAGDLVWTVDDQVEGTHFRRDLLAFEDIGYRALMAAASDVAAMGASPVGILSSLVIPEGVDDAAFDALVAGTAEAARDLGAPVVGGNLARGPCLVVTTTVLGAVRRPVPRGGARPGDTVYLAGAVGLAAAGFAWLAGRDGAPGAEPILEEPEGVAAAITAWRRPRARIADGLAMAAHATAAVDVSDGLARDAGHLAEASSVRLVIDEPAILGAAPRALALACTRIGRSALALCLFGGEDYALLATSRAPLEGFVAIGTVTEGAGLALRDASGREAPLEPRGFDHFARVT